MVSANYLTSSNAAQVDTTCQHWQPVEQTGVVIIQTPSCFGNSYHLNNCNKVKVF